MRAPCLCPQPPGQEGQPNCALSHSIPHCHSHQDVQRPCKAWKDGGNGFYIQVKYYYSGFSSEAPLLTGHWILASFALELSALLWITQSPAVLAGCHIYTFLRCFPCHSNPRKRGYWFWFKSPDPEDIPRACALRIFSFPLISLWDHLSAAICCVSPLNCFPATMVPQRALG